MRFKQSNFAFDNPGIWQIPGLLPKNFVKHALCIMQRLGLQAALTADQHFEQAGFQALLRANERL